MINNETLLRWVEDNNIEARTIEYFWNAFNNYKDDLSKEEFETYFDNDYEKYIKLWFRSISQRVVFLDCLDEDNENIDVIEAVIEIGYKDDRHYGTYSAYYNFLGDIIDDELDCEWERFYINLRKEILEEFKMEFVNTAVIEGSEHESALIIVNKVIGKIRKEWDAEESN